MFHKCHLQEGSVNDKIILECICTEMLSTQ